MGIGMLLFFHSFLMAWFVVSSTSAVNFCMLFFVFCFFKDLTTGIWRDSERDFHHQ